MDKIILVFCNGLSCFIITAILFQFMNDRYKKTFRKKYTYLFIEMIIVLCMAAVNLISNSLLNLVSWSVAVGAAVYFLYYEDAHKPLRRILECEAFMFCMTVCESLGVILLRWFLQTVYVKNLNDDIWYCLEAIFSKIILVFLYYIVISRLMKKKNISYSKTQYFIYVIMLAYSLINMLIVIEIYTQGQISYLCTINMGCIVLADLYLLYFVKMADEKNYYENQVKALEQQANIQYEYYLAQIKKYDRTVQILHDVKKHIRAIEGLYETDKKYIASKYTNEIGDLLQPLIPMEYTGNPILNILLTDKEMSMMDKGIEMDIKIDNVDLDFIEPIDVTTIFGNLLDNAIEAAEKVKGKKYIYIKISSFHQMVVIRIENSCTVVKWKNGFPVSEKGKNRGLGLLNVQSSIQRYDGNLSLKQENQKFIAELFLNS
ncbi:MAG: GHKL domain-containing protein [Lachnospiraceae bacterium]|nr:GHKL domain-containing protein [Lachnospiraceae bacterium]